MRNCPSLPNRIYHRGITKVKSPPYQQLAIKVGTGDFNQVGIMVKVEISTTVVYHGSYQGNTTMVRVRKALL
ncbi:hypothetical protein CW304_23285 [Bacillus sp. UFRGS-B20]|nr:hypothetical protein CW304_23285 [Bacillus sp. UFRGS-B20]